MTKSHQTLSYLMTFKFLYIQPFNVLESIIEDIKRVVDCFNIAMFNLNFYLTFLS